MDPEAALELVKHGATLLLLDVPQYTLFGIDTQVTKFHNFKVLGTKVSLFFNRFLLLADVFSGAFF